YFFRYIDSHVFPIQGLLESFFAKLHLNLCFFYMIPIKYFQSCSNNSPYNQIQSMCHDHYFQLMTSSMFPATLPMMQQKYSYQLMYWYYCFSKFLPPIYMCLSIYNSVKIPFPLIVFF